MKIICLQENLRAALSLAERIIGKNLSLPILNNVLLKIEKGFLKISSTNLEIGLHVWVPGKVEREGEVSIRAKLLSEYINNLPEGKVTLDAKNNKLQVKSDQFKATLLGIETKEYPIIPALKEKKSYIEFQATTLQESLQQVINAASISDNRLELNGIFFRIGKMVIKIAATDTFRLAEKTITDAIIHFGIGKEEEIKCILPYRTAQELLKILEGKEKVKMYLHENQCFFETENVYLVSRLIEGDYVDYEQIIPKGFKTKIHLQKQELMNAIKLSALFSSKINDIKITTNKKNSLLEVSAKDFELGENISEVPAKIEGEDVEILFNARQLLDGLSNLKENEVTFEMNDKHQPGFLRSQAQRDYFYIIMPLNI
jgi:DNA polymerase-3 subunit beta